MRNKKVSSGSRRKGSRPVGWGVASRGRQSKKDVQAAEILRKSKIHKNWNAGIVAGSLLTIYGRKPPKIILHEKVPENVLKIIDKMLRYRLKKEKGNR